MPFASLQWLLPILRPENIAMLKDARPDLAERLAEPGMLPDVIIDAAEFMGTEVQPYERKYLNDIPLTVQEAIRGPVSMAVELGYEVHVSYTPAYAFAVTVTQWGEGHQAVTVAVSGPATSYGPTFDEQNATLLP